MFNMPKYLFLSKQLKSMLLNVNIDLLSNESYQSYSSAQLRKRDWRTVAKEEGKYFK